MINRQKCGRTMCLFFALVLAVSSVTACTQNNASDEVIEESIEDMETTSQGNEGYDESDSVLGETESSEEETENEDEDEDETIEESSQEIESDLNDTSEEETETEAEKENEQESESAEETAEETEAEVETETEAESAVETTQAAPDMNFAVSDTADETLYSTTSLNVREGPGTAYGKLFTLSLNQEVTKNGDCGNGWVRIVTSSGKTGYCNAKYLSSSPVETQAAAVSSSGVTAVQGLVKDCTDAEYQAALNGWNLIPSEWRARFINDGWTITVTDNNFWSRYGYGRIAGITVYGEKAIYVRATAKAARIPSTVCHEFGHYLDYADGWPSQTSEFNSLYNSEKGGFSEYMGVGDNHSISNTYEYFAQIIAQILCAKSTESSAPNSFAYVRRYFNY